MQRLHKKKYTLAQEIITKLSSMSTQERNSESKEVLAIISTLPEWNSAKHVLGYFPLKDEFPILPLLRKGFQSGKQIYLPRIKNKHMNFTLWENVQEDTLKMNHLGTMESISSITWGDGSENSKKIIASSIILVPGLALGKQGERLGRGGGYYDRFLSIHTIYSIAPCFKIQICDSIPMQEHDYILDRVVYAPKQIIALRKL